MLETKNVERIKVERVKEIRRYIESEKPNNTFLDAYLYRTLHVFPL